MNDCGAQNDQCANYVPDSTESDRIVLKQNEYKCVELISHGSGTPTITKRYSGHPKPDLDESTRYIYRSLDFFRESFSDILLSPRPLAMDLTCYQVEMEYLSELPNAKLLSLKTLNLANDFFHRCYAIDDDRGFLRTIHGSVTVTPAAQSLLDEGFPMRLGFKGDLGQNLCLEGNRLIFADIDSICLEPLGLSEVVLYAELFARIHSFDNLSLLFRGTPPVPVAFQYLDLKKREQLVNAAIERMSLYITGLPNIVQWLKRTISGHLLGRAGLTLP